MPATLRRRIIASPIAWPAVFPRRAMSVLRYDTRLVARSLDWLIRSGETMNIGYELDPMNRGQLGWFVSAVTGAEIGQVRAWMRELEQDEEGEHEADPAGELRELGDLAPVWPDEVLAVAIARAHALGARVAAHVFGEDALPGLIAAGTLRRGDAVHALPSGFCGAHVAPSQ